MEAVKRDLKRQKSAKHLKMREVSERTRDESILAPNANHHPSPMP